MAKTTNLIPAARRWRSPRPSRWTQTQGPPRLRALAPRPWPGMCDVCGELNELGGVGAVAGWCGADAVAGWCVAVVVAGWCVADAVACWCVADAVAGWCVADAVAGWCGWCVAGVGEGWGACLLANHDFTAGAHGRSSNKGRLTFNFGATEFLGHRAANWHGPPRARTRMCLCTYIVT